MNITRFMKEKTSSLSAGSEMPLKDAGNKNIKRENVKTTIECSSIFLFLK